MNTPAFLGTLCLAGSVCAQPVIRQIPLPPNAYPAALSGNGEHLCGTIYSSQIRGFHWSPATGLQLLHPTQSTDRTTARGVANDGTTVGDRQYEGSVFGTPTYFVLPTRWSPAGAMSNLKFPLISPRFGGRANYISPSGTIIVGSVLTEEAGFSDHPAAWAAPLFNWQAAPGSSYGQAMALSGDNAVAVGFFVTAPYIEHPFRWPQGGAIIELPSPPGFRARATAVSFDGSVIVGHTNEEPQPAPIPLRWDSGALDVLPRLNALSATAIGISGDSATIVGNRVLSNGENVAALVWHNRIPLTLADFLAARGVPLTGWNLTNVAGISSDGLTFAGLGTFQGAACGWIVTLPSCSANCDASTLAPILNINDFFCFQQRFAAGDSSANCDGSTTAPTLNISDYICFTNQYAAGCP